MTETPSNNPLPPETQPAIDPIRELQLAFAKLRAQMIGILIILIILGLGLNIFLLRQVGMARKQATELEQFVGAYAKTGVPQLNDFLSRLREFSKDNPDFTPILNKYFLPPGKTSAPPALPSPTSPPRP